MSGIFISAADARTQALATTTPLVINEVHAIELAIIAAVETSLLVATVSTTTMTAPDMSQEPAEAFYQVFTGAVVDALKTAQMAQVKTYFTDLGYSVAQILNTVSGDTFKWQIKW